MHEAEHVAADEVLRPRGAHRAQGGGIGEHDLAFAVDGDAVGRHLDQPAVALLALAKGRLRLAALGHVDHHSAEAHRLAAGVAHEGDRRLHGAAGTVLAHHLELGVLEQAAGGEDLSDAVVEPPPVLGVGQAAAAPALQLLAAVAERAAERVVEEGQLAGEVHLVVALVHALPGWRGASPR